MRTDLKGSLKEERGKGEGGAELRRIHQTTSFLREVSRCLVLSGETSWRAG